MLNILATVDLLTVIPSMLGSDVISATVHLPLRWWNSTGSSCSSSLMRDAALTQASLSGLFLLAVHHEWRRPFRNRPHADGKLFCDSIDGYAFASHLHFKFPPVVTLARALAHEMWQCSPLCARKLDGQHWRNTQPFIGIGKLLLEISLSISH